MKNAVTGATAVTGPQKGQEREPTKGKLQRAPAGRQAGTGAKINPAPMHGTCTKVLKKKTRRA